MEQSKFIPGVTTEESGVVMNMESAEEAVREVDFTEDEDLEMIRGNEEDFIQGLIHAAGYAQKNRNLRLSGTENCFLHSISGLYRKMNMKDARRKIPDLSAIKDWA